MSRFFSLFAVALLSIAVVAQGQLDIRPWFPDNPTMDFFPGKLGNLVIGVRNNGGLSYNLTGPRAELALIFNPDMIVYNFTDMPFRPQTLGPHEEINVEYPLYFPGNMPPREFLLMLGMAYEQNEQYSFQPFYNETITVIQPSTLIDVELIGLYVIGALALVGLGYGVLEFAKTKGWVKRTKKSKSSKTATVATDKAEWLQGTVADRRKKN